MKLTLAEKLFAYRALKKWTQRRAASFWGVGFWTYRAWEENPNAPPPTVRAELPKIELSKQLRYVILRRREGMTQSDLARELKVSRQWVNRMELGLESDQLLRDYWAS